MPIVSGLGGEAFSAWHGEPVVFEVYVPNRTKNDDEVGAELHATWVGLIARAVCEVAGGCTETQGTGYWVRPNDGYLVRERTSVLRTATTRAALVGGLARLRQVLVQYGRECEQHTVAFALNGEMFGIDPTRAY
jgi:hypothetical protein